MCGFTGYFYVNGKRERSNKNIIKMLLLQKHRGPDDSGVVAVNTDQGIFEPISHEIEATFSEPSNLILGFNRLSILDLTANGHQPMISSDGKVILMLNGEIYNAHDFKEELKSKGYAFKSTTDTEVVLNLYQEYGIDGIINKLNGMFAMAIYDFRLKTLFLIRDRYGIKPLYILQKSDCIAFSSEMKSFKALPDFKFEFDDSRLNEFLLFRNLVNKTLFKHIVNCTPGTYISVNTSGQIKEHKYYEIDEEGIEPYNGKDPILFLDQILEESVERQMISDVRLGSQLSGGVDSSLVTWFAAKSLSSGNLETISIVFHDPRFSEEKYVDQVSNKLNLIAHKYNLDAEYYFHEMEKATWHFEQPLNHPNTIGIFLLSQQAKKHVTVLLSGEGADESLAGYDRFVDSLYFSLFSRRFLGRLKQNANNLSAFLKYQINPDLRLIMSSSFGSISSVKAMKKDFSFENAIEERMKTLDRLNGDILLKHRKYELLTFLPDLLMRQDKMSMAHSIENRVPFLDNEMVKTSLNIPAELLIKRKNKEIETKVLLKDSCAVKFDEKFAYRTKMGFGIPLREFMKSRKFRERWNDQTKPGIENRGIFNGEYLNKWMTNLNKINNVQLDALWLMTGFEMWARQYLD